MAVSVLLTPEFGWNEKARRYVESRSKRFVKFSDLRSAVDASITKSQQRMKVLSQGLVEGGISLPEWQRNMAAQVGLNHLGNASAAAGGWAQLSGADRARVSDVIRGQLDYLENFAQQISSGKQPVNNGLVTRATMYGDAGRATYESERGRREELAGMDEERNILGSADHCSGCLAATSAGWATIGSLIPVGSRQCKTSCHCTMEYRSYAALVQAA